MGISLSAVAALCEGRFYGNASCSIQACAPRFEQAAPGLLVLAETQGQAEQAWLTGAAVMAGETLAGELAEKGTNALVAVKYPRLCFFAVMRLLQAYTDLAEDAASAQCHVAASAEVHPTALLAPGCVIRPGAHIGAYALLFPGVVVERDALVGAGCVLQARAFVGRGVALGRLCEIGPNSVIGAEPQEFVAANGVWTRQPGRGGLQLADRVVVGANSVIECGTKKPATLAEDVLLGGQVYLAHDCHLARGVVVIGQSGFASGVCVEEGAMIMARVGVNVDVRIGAGAFVMATSGVTKNVAAGARVWGNPARDRRDALRGIVNSRRVRNGA
jgi:UDP-3-O-[3-hydroxymyristoyl] glucosamine N-acyltransferase